jgi:hypothetical protein
VETIQCSKENVQTTIYKTYSTKAGRHDIAESGGKHNQNQNQIKNRTTFEQWLCNV